MYIKSIDGNTLTVRRGEDGTMKKAHINGDVVNVVNAADDAELQLGDDFGFSEYRYDYSDGKTFSPTKGTDV